MVTWTTFGSWLQGDERGYVKNGQILKGDEKIKKFCQDFQKGDTVILNPAESQIAKQSILKEADRIGQAIKAIEVCTNHVHIAAESYNESIERMVSRYKTIAMFALYENGRSGKIWTRGFDKRFCYSQEELDRKIRYIQNHDIRR